MLNSKFFGIGRIVNHRYLAANIVNNPVVYHIEVKEFIETSVQLVYNVRPAS